MLKKIIVSSLLFCLTAHAAGEMGKAPLAFLKRPHFPRTTDGGTSTFKYILLNNTPVTLPLTISTPTVASGNITLSSSTCGATLTPSATCNLIYLFTAPANPSSTPLNITGSFQIAYHGRYPLTDTRIRFVVPKDAPEFIEQPNFSPPISVPSDGTYTLRYAVKNNLSTTITSVSFSPIVSSGSIIANGGTCGSSIASGATCTKTFLFTAPANAGGTDTSVTGTMALNYTDVGPQTLNGDALAFSITPEPKASISVLENSLMFPSRDFGNADIYTGKITISNNGTRSITGVTRATSGVTFVSTTCSFPLTAGQTCTDTYSSSIPITTSSTVQLTPNGSTGAGNTVTVPVSGLGVRALAPPTDTTVGLTLVNGCADTANDGGLIMITNNTNETLFNIAISASSALSATITNPPFSEDNNVYCNGHTLAPNEYCEFRVASAATAGTTGEITIHASLTNGLTISPAHHYNLLTKVVAAAASNQFNALYPSGGSLTGGFIFVSDNTCNLVEVKYSASPPSGGATWPEAASICTAKTAPQDWRLTDLGPTPVAFLPRFSPITGEALAIQQARLDLEFGVWLSPFSSTDFAWRTVLAEGIGTQMTLNEKAETFNADTLCVRAFTTNTDGG